MYVLASLESPFIGTNLITLGISIINRSPKPIPNGYSRKLSSFIFRLLEKDPHDRPDIEKVIKIAFGNKFFEESSNAISENLAFDEEIFPIKFLKILRPRPLPLVLNLEMPFKPIFREKLKKSVFAEPNDSKNESSEKKLALSDRELLKNRSVPLIKGEINETRCKTFDSRPQSSAGERTSQQITRPGTAKPSLRTIIRSNTSVKINNFVRPSVTSKPKFTINDLLRYQINNV